MRCAKDACAKPARSLLFANARSGSQHATKVRMKGQATVEAALLIPAVIVGLGLSLYAIIKYNKGLF